MIDHIALISEYATNSVGNTWASIKLKCVTVCLYSVPALTRGARTLASPWTARRRDNEIHAIRSRYTKHNSLVKRNRNVKIRRVLNLWTFERVRTDGKSISACNFISSYYWKSKRSRLSLCTHPISTERFGLRMLTMTSALNSEIMQCVLHLINRTLI